MLAHRAAYELFVGEIPEQMLVLHKCDNPPCVNPNHLYIGTHLDNMRDKRERGRAARVCGEAQGNAKLKSEQVLSIRRIYAAAPWGIKEKVMLALARNYGVGNSTVRKLLHRVSWKHL